MLVFLLTLQNSPLCWHIFLLLDLVVWYFAFFFLLSVVPGVQASLAPIAWTDTEGVQRELCLSEYRASLTRILIGAFCFQPLQS